MHSFFGYTLLLLASWMTQVTAIPTVSVVGSKFFTSDGKQYYIKGIAYQLIEDDPLVDTVQCQRDAALMQQLGANAIRVYHVNATADHTGCMNAFAAAGIYLFVDVDSFKTYIRYGDESSWTKNKSDEYRAIVDNFQQFDNTAGFFVGNEVLNVLEDQHAAPFLLSATVDLKGYMQARGYRKIPIGYSATDTMVLRPMLHDYLACRPNVTERLDFYGLNSYEWCGNAATFQTSGYVFLQEAFKNFPIPVFLSEDGCNTAPPRTFNDQAAIFGPEMAGTWSGAIIYEWIQEMNNYGLISYGPKLGDDVNQGTSVIQGFTRSGVPTPVQPDFDNLKAQWAAAKPTGVASSAYVATYKTTAPTCPSSTANGWTVNALAPLPTAGQDAVASGMPSWVPKGSITVTGISTYATTARTSSSASSTLSRATSATGAAASATRTGSASSTYSHLLSLAELTFMGTIVTALTLGSGILFWL